MTYLIGHNTETSHLPQEEYAQRHNPLYEAESPEIVEGRQRNTYT